MENSSFINTMDLFKNNHHLLLKGKWGVEKETLRTTKDGKLATSPHPEKFGNKLTNPYITTDFSESQIEIITPAFTSIEKTYRFLNLLQNYVEKNIGDEYLWQFSMPCILPEDDKINVAEYDDSINGKINSIYRNGLASRYGKKMQLISGIHYNFSFAIEFWDFLFNNAKMGNNKNDFINNKYIAIARNYIRYRWILIYLFGASPVADESYIENEDMRSELNKYDSYATSLRMSPLGYSSKNRTRLDVSFNSLNEYIYGLETILNTDNVEHERLGLFKDGKQIQLNYHILQKESEFYSSVRLKSGVDKNASNLEGLKTKGIDYLEIRSIDLNPYYRTSIGLRQMYFIHVFIIYCMFENNTFLTDEENNIIADNDTKVALLGRKNGLDLKNMNGKIINLKEWAFEILDKLSKIAQLLDLNYNSNGFQKIILDEYKKINNPDLLPSGRIFNSIRKNKSTFADYGLRLSKKYFKRSRHFKGGKVWTS